MLHFPLDPGLCCVRKHVDGGTILFEIYPDLKGKHFQRHVFLLLLFIYLSCVRFNSSKYVLKAVLLGSEACSCVYLTVHSCPIQFPLHRYILFLSTISKNEITYYNHILECLDQNVLLGIFFFLFLDFGRLFFYQLHL